MINSDGVVGDINKTVLYSNITYKVGFQPKILFKVGFGMMATIILIFIDGVLIFENLFLVTP